MGHGLWQIFMKKDQPVRLIYFAEHKLSPAHHFACDIQRYITLKRNVLIVITISLKTIPKSLFQ